MTKKNLLKFPENKSTGKRVIDENYQQQFQKINGEHPLKNSSPNTYVDYMSKRRKNGKVAFFNFRLAKEMGLISENHPHQLNPELSEAILDAFSITIINEYDLLNPKNIDPEEMLPNTYMATRYLQLQHPNKQGKTSGDGRSIWNGSLTFNKKTWDISSCGVGATCLSPATAIHKKFFKTGDKIVSYGCGHADLEDGIGAALLSEIFHHNNISTERTLAIIEFERGLSINIRAGHNLLRPSHFFCHLKQNNFETCKSLTDYYIDRQQKNDNWPKFKNDKEAYQYFLQKTTEQFALMTARFEREYIFCWMDWDGDNILMDGGIIDYGSVRQFGLYHSEYRYDDVERFSTTIAEQKIKARYIIQTFVQMFDFLLTGKKKNVHSFSRHPQLKIFDQLYQKEKERLLLIKMGLTPQEAKIVMEKRPSLIHQFEEVFCYFEKAKSKRGLIKVADGVNCNALFSTRDLLRELPIHLKNEYLRIPSHLFMNILSSKYCTKHELEVTPYRHRKIKLFQQYYCQILEFIARETKQPFENYLGKIVDRSSLINRFDRITGDAVVILSERLKDKRKKLSNDDFHAIVDEVIYEQILVPEVKNQFQIIHLSEHKKEQQQLFHNLLHVIKTCRYGI